MFGLQPFAPGYGNSTGTKDVTFGITIAVPTNEVDVGITFEDRLVPDHAFMLVLPFEIRKISVQSGSGFGSVKSLHAYNVSDSSSVLVFTWENYQNQSSWTIGGVRMTFLAVGSLVSGQRGEYEFYFPLGVYPTQAVIDNATALAPPLTLLSISSGFNATVNVVIPAGSRLQQLIPSTASLEESTFGSTGDEYGWAFITPQSLSSVAINYQNPTEVDAYQKDLFVGGILLGIGISLMFTVALEAFRFVHDKATSDDW